MHLITLQSRKAIPVLLNKKPFISDFEHILSSKVELTEHRELYEKTKLKAYQLLMKQYDYKNPPIFCCIVDTIADFDLISSKKDKIIIEMEVPDEYVKVHGFENWAYIYYLIYKNYLTESIYDMLKNGLDGKNIDYNQAVQAVIPYINPEWVLGIWKPCESFVTHFSGGAVLDECQFRHNILWKNRNYKGNIS